MSLVSCSYLLYLAALRSLPKLIYSSSIVSWCGVDALETDLSAIFKKLFCLNSTVRQKPGFWFDLLDPLDEITIAIRKANINF